jgi:hypothetical protein
MRVFRGMFHQGYFGAAFMNKKEHERLLGLERMRRYRERYPERTRERYLRWKNKDPQRYENSKRKQKPLIVIFRAYFRKRLHRFLFGEKTYWKFRDIYRARVSEYKNKNPAIIAAQNASRRALEFMAQPRWVNRNEIVAIYAQAQRKSLLTGIPYHVDHIWPLHGDGFIGLHVPWNLQVITQTENIRKHNKRPDRVKLCQ